MPSGIERLESRRLLSAGEIDATFGSGGITTLDLAGETETIAQLLPAPNGKLLAFGRADSGNRLVIARFNSDGKLDTTFATGGVSQTTVIVPNMGDPGAIAVDASTGRFAAIYSTSATGQPAGAAVFTANGQVDHSFSTDGLIQQDQAFIAFEKVAFQSDGRLIVAGRGYDLNGVDPNQPYNPGDYVDPVLVRRYNLNGTQDVNGFGNGTGAGRGTTALNHADAIEDFEVMSDGRIILATHYADTTDGQNLMGQELFRLTSTGQLDNAFDADGSLTFGESGDIATSQTLDMDVLADGSILTLSSEGTLNLVLHKFNSNGTPASGFNTEFDRLGRFPSSLGVASSSGDIFLFGNGAVARYSPNGEADYTYGIDGVATVSNGLALRVNANGSVVVGGSTGGEDWMLTRLQGGAGTPRKATLNRKGTLIFKTTNDDDTISINMRYRDNRLIVRLGTQTQSFTPSKVKRIAIFAMDGDDRVTLGAGVRGSYVEGGLGNDTLNGGANGDVLLGNDGQDQLFGNDGNDTCVGGAGNDYCVGGAQNDDLFGDDGLDTLSGAGGNDRLFGGEQNDTLMGGTGADSAMSDSRDKRDSIETLMA